MSTEELSLLNWLSTDDSQHGECYGKALDRVMNLGFVEWKRRDARGDNYGWVGLTDTGREALKIGRASCSHPYEAATRYGGLACGVCGTPAER